MNVLIAPDKFKGSLSAVEVARAIAEGWSAVRPSDELSLAPLADGGTGTAAVVLDVVGGARAVEESVLNAVGRRRQAMWVLLPDGRGLIESAAAAGIHDLGAHELNPALATSFGVGELIAAAVNRGVREVMIGLGGTANMDGGAGMALALGHSLVARDGSPIGPGAAGLTQLESVERAAPLEVDVVILTDVDNPLLGPTGAVATYGPQKGISSENLPWVESAMETYATIVERDLAGGPWRQYPGTGAAGGMGFALRAFCGARSRSGAEVVADLVGFNRLVATADVVITGEGRLDDQTWWGKTPGYVAKRAQSAGARTCAIAGVIQQGADRGFDLSKALGPEGLRRPAELVRQRAAELAQLI